MMLLLTVAAAAACLAACSSAPVLVSRSAEVSPPRKAVPSFVAGSRKVFTNWATGAAGADDAQRLAFNNCLAMQVGAELGVTVEGGSESYEQEKNGVYTYSFRTSTKTKQVPVKLAGVRVEQHYEECWKTAGEIRCDGYVRLSIPLAELALAARMIRGRVVLVWACAGPDGYACPTNLEEEVRSAADRCGVPLLSGAEAGGDCRKLAEELDAAYLFKVRFQVGIAGKEGKATFARGSGSAELVETRDCKVKRTVDTGEMKAGGYSRDDALRLTLKDICKRLAGRIESAGFGEVLTGGEK